MASFPSPGIRDSPASPGRGKRATIVAQFDATQIHLERISLVQIMLFMPFFFGFILYDYAAGLSLYMLTNAILGILMMKFLKVNVATAMLASGT